MKKLVLLSSLFLIELFAYSSNVKAAYAIGIFDSSGNGENIQHIRTTQNDYNGTCYSKVFVVGNSFKVKPTVKIGNSIGHYESSEPIYNIRNLKIGEVMLFKHYGVTNGYIKVMLKDKILESKTFIK